MVDITGSSAGAAYYYFYYDWEVKEQDIECASTRVPATVIVQNPTSIDDVNYNAAVSIFPNPSTGLINIAINDIKIQTLSINVLTLPAKKFWICE